MRDLAGRGSGPFHREAALSLAQALHHGHWDGLRHLAQCSEVAVIHQPRWQTLAARLGEKAKRAAEECFDQVVLLEQGRLVYTGPVADSVGYFKEVGGFTDHGSS